MNVYLKAALDNPPAHHDLSMLIQSLEAESGKKLARWVRDRLWDFHRIDFHQLRAVIEKLAQAIEQYSESKRQSKRDRTGDSAHLG